MRKRTQSREIALQVLYQLDIRGEEFLNELEGFLSAKPRDTSIIAFARDIINGYCSNQDAINNLITKSTLNWDISRMSMIDRNLLRLATYEIMFRDDIPPAVSINEAVDLAKKYGNDDSGEFHVNSKTT